MTMQPAIALYSDSVGAEPSLEQIAALRHQPLDQSGEKLPQRILHRARRAAVHAGDHVAISVQSQGYGAVPKKLLHVLGMDVAGE